MRRVDNTKKHPRREITGSSITTPNQSISLRTILSRIGNGEPINAKLRKHEPLPPDGEIDDDFETGTREILDLTDVQRIAEELEEKEQQHRDELEKKRQQQREEEFEAEVAKRIASKEQNINEQ